MGAVVLISISFIPIFETVKLALFSFKHLPDSVYRVSRVGF